MIKRRQKPDGLPYRVYERRGSRVYSIGYKADGGRWLFRLQCPAGAISQIAELRREAIDRANRLSNGAPTVGTVAALIDAWIARQKALPAGTVGKRAASTLAENEREARMLKAAMGHMLVTQLEKADAYEYLDACLMAKDKAGKPRPRPEKGNKEISLLRTILEWGVRIRAITANPFDGVEKLVTNKVDRLVSAQEMALALEVGRRLGGPQLIVALALRTAWLCLRRSVEVRAMTRGQITDDGIVWTGAKRKAGTAEKVALIEWSDELRATVDEALALKRNKVSGTLYVFGNMSGQRYTKGGWKATLSVLMTECQAEAARRKLAFQPFSLQDCRPKGVSDKLARGDQDTTDAALHSNSRMIEQVYDRRRVRVAKPAA
jgi:integrase